MPNTLHFPTPPTTGPALAASRAVTDDAASWAALRGRAVLLATDGSAGSVAAARVALELAERHGAVIHVISVLDTRAIPIPIPAPLNFGLAMAVDTIAGEEIHRNQAKAIQDAISAEVGERIDWPVQVVLGTPAGAIAREGKRVGAVLIIVGLQRHARLARAIHDETAVQVMRAAPCAVLGVVPGTQSLPERVMIAMDFGNGSVAAARSACAVSASGAVVTLAYVEMPPGSLSPGGETSIHTLGVTAAFAQIVTELHSEDVVMESIVLDHDVARTPAEVLLQYADDAGCDLIAAGSAHHGRIDRWIMGSVSTDLAHDGRRSVLIVPPGPEAT